MQSDAGAVDFDRVSVDHGCCSSKRCLCIRRKRKWESDQHGSDAGDQAGTGTLRHLIQVSCPDRLLVARISEP